MNIENLDHDEVNKFDELAARWWDKDGEFKPLHQINPLRVGFIKERSALEGKKVLDVGCGGGILSQALGELGAEVIGIDASERTIGVAKAHSELIKSDVEFFQHTIEDFIASNPNKKFDVITCLEMLEHVPSPGDIIKSCSNLLNDNGDIFFSTINRNPKSYLFAVIGAEYVLRWLPIGTHEWEKFVKPENLISICQKNSLKLKKIDGMTFNPLFDQWKVSSDKSVNYITEFEKV